jgi:hypothetical protein
MPTPSQGFGLRSCRGWVFTFFWIHHKPISDNLVSLSLVIHDTDIVPGNCKFLCTVIVICSKHGHPVINLHVIINPLKQKCYPGAICFRSTPILWVTIFKCRGGDPVKPRLARCINLLKTRTFRANESKVVLVNLHAKPVPNDLTEKYQIKKLACLRNMLTVPASGSG